MRHPLKQPRPILSLFRHSKLPDVAGYLLLVLAVIWFVLRGAESQGYHWQWYRVPELLFSIQGGEFTVGPILKGLFITLHITWISLILSSVIGLVTALLRLTPSLGGRTLARLYLETVRNTPLLVQLFFVYFIIAPVLHLDRLYAAVFALSLFEGSFASEIYRAGITSIAKGQQAVRIAMDPVKNMISVRAEPMLNAKKFNRVNMLCPRRFKEFDPVVQGAACCAPTSQPHRSIFHVHNGQY